MNKRYFLAITLMIGMSTTSVFGRIIQFNGFYNNTNIPTLYGSWSYPQPGDPCGMVYQDLGYDERISAVATLSTYGATIGSGNNLNGMMAILVRSRIERWSKSTIYASGCPPYNTPLLPIPGNGITYYNPPTAYYGFKTTIGGLTYYGWMKVEMGNYVAYIEDIPGFSVKVGDMMGFQTYPAGFVKLSGVVYRDNNIDGAYNTGDTPLPYQRVTLENTIYAAATGSDGSYSMMVPGNLLSGSKNIKLNISDRDVYNTPATGTRTITFPQNSDVANLNFGINYNLTTASQQRIKVSVQEVNRHRRCFKSSIQVVIENKSNIALTDVPVLLEIPAYVEILNSTPAYQSLQAKVATYTIPSIAAYGSYTIALTDSIICGVEAIRGQTQCYRASINIPFEGSDVFPYYECQDSMHLFKLVNTGNAAMTDSLNYKLFLNNVLQGTYKYMTTAQDTFYIGIPNDGRSARLEVYQELSNTRTNLRYIIAEGCGTLNVLAQNIGMGDPLSNSDDLYYSAMNCFNIRDSYDPNELIASPTGWGTEHKILKEQLISYHIGFQNTGSADAVSIVLVDTLSSALDPSTFKILRSTHAFTSELTPTADGRYRLAVKYAGINLPPSSSDEPGSHGYVEFSILPKSTTSIGTPIKNQAFIYFDFNSYIATNTVLQTIALPDVVSNPINVRTSGGEFDVDNQTLTYGDSPAAPVLSTNAGTAGLSATSLSPDVVTFESGKLVIHKSGTATLNYKHNGNARYLPITGTKQRTVTVSKAPLSIAAVSKERFVGNQNPVLEWIATGFVYNEDASVLQGNPEITCTADASSAISEYPITISAGTLSADNYDMTYTNGTLKVVQVTGIQDWTASGIQVYPVPSKGGKFTVDVPYEKLDHITLTDLLGISEVHEQGQINSQLQGMVVMRIYTDKGIYVGKVELTR